tara:strand:- start:35035 stop:36096 length:1062 start_codon:yes stop_codon:yes gene_type:complete
LFSTYKDKLTAEKAFVKLLRGNDLGVSAAEAMEQIHVIEGRTSLSAGLLASLVQKSGRFRYKVLVSNAHECEILFSERIDGAWEPCGPPVRFDDEDVKRAGLDKPTQNGKPSSHTKYPTDMKFARCLSRGVRQHCNSVTGGSVYVHGEIEDELEADKVRQVGAPAGPSPQRAEAAERAAEDLLPEIPDAWGLAVDARRDLAAALETARAGATLQAIEVLEGLTAQIRKGMAGVAQRDAKPANRDAKPDKPEPEPETLTNKERARRALEAEEAAAAAEGADGEAELIEARSGASRLAQSILDPGSRGKACAAIDCARTLAAVETVRSRIQATLVAQEDAHHAPASADVDLGGLA